MMREIFFVQTVRVQSPGDPGSSGQGSEEHIDTIGNGQSIGLEIEGVRQAFFLTTPRGY